MLVRAPLEPGGDGDGCRLAHRVSTGTADLDLRVANVVEVTFDGVPGDEIRSSLTLFHDDGGQAMAVTLQSGATTAIDLGDYPMIVDGSDCP